MRILVTGATGFIGTNLTRELRKNNDLFILGQFEGDPEKLGLPGIVMTDDIQQLAETVNIQRLDNHPVPLNVNELRLMYENIFQSYEG